MRVASWQNLSPFFPRRALFGFEGDMLHRLIALVAWASLAFIAYATLARVGFIYAVYFTFAPIFKYPTVRTFVRIRRAPSCLWHGIS